MAQLLMGFYDEAKEIAGFPGQLNLAMITGISGPKAETAEDSADNLAVFRDALEQIKQAA